MIPERPLGATGEELSIIGIGGWDVAAASSEKESIAIMHEVIDAGVNLFDNCREYHEGYAEEIMGKALKAGKIRYICFTGHASPRFHLAMLEYDFAWDAVQMPTNVLDAHYDSFKRNVLPVLNDRNIGVLGMKSLASQEGRIEDHRVSDWGCNFHAEKAAG